MLNMGLESPVSKTTAGNLFHIELSRQLSDFLMEPLRQVWRVEKREEMRRGETIPTFIKHSRKEVFCP